MRRSIKESTLSPHVSKMPNNFQSHLLLQHYYSSITDIHAKKSQRFTKVKPNFFRLFINQFFILSRLKLLSSSRAYPQISKQWRSIEQASCLKSHKNPIGQIHNLQTSFKKTPWTQWTLKQGPFGDWRREGCKGGRIALVRIGCQENWTPRHSCDSFIKSQHSKEQHHLPLISIGMRHDKQNRIFQRRRFHITPREITTVERENTRSLIISVIPLHK